MTLLWLQMKFARAQVSIFMLAMLLQRSPAIRVLTVLEKALSQPVARIVQGTTWLATTMGVFHATAGATTLTTAPLHNGSGVHEATVGDYVGIVFTITGAPAKPARWTMEGRIAPGLEVKTPEVLISEAGNPSVNGTYVFNGSANGAVAYTRFNSSGLALFSLILQNPETRTWAIVSGSPNAGNSSVLYTNSSASNAITGFSPLINDTGWTAVSGGLPVPRSVNADKIPVNNAIEGEWLVMEGVPTTSDIFNYVLAVRAFNASGDTSASPHELQINVAAPSIQFLWGPRSMSVPTGGRAQFFFEAEEEADTIQWLKDESLLDGQSGPTLILTETTASDAGVYSVSLTKDGISSISDGALLTIDDDAAAATVELTNQGFVQQGSDVLVSHLVIEGPSAATILLRGLGPELEGANASGVLGDPRLELSRTIFEGEVEVGAQALLSNDDWEVGPNAVELAAVLGTSGKSLEAGSKDAAILVTLPEGTYRIKLSGDGEWTGAGLAEMIVIE